MSDLNRIVTFNSRIYRAKISRINFLSLFYWKKLNVNFPFYFSFDYIEWSSFCLPVSIAISLLTILWFLSIFRLIAVSKKVEVNCLSRQAASNLRSYICHCLIPNRRQILYFALLQDHTNQFELQKTTFFSNIQNKMRIHPKHAINFEGASLNYSMPLVEHKRCAQNNWLWLHKFEHAYEPLPSFIVLFKQFSSSS